MDITPDNQSLASKSISALKWNYIGRLVSLSLQFGIGIILARLLGPEPFGLVAIALFVQGLGNLFAEGGLGAALIQSKKISEHDIRSVFSTQLVIGIIMSSAIAGAAPLLAAFFHEPNATPVIMIMSLSFTIQAIGQTANALIRRNFEFKKIQIISLISYCIGYLGLGLPMATLGYGVWSLVAAQLSQTSINAFATYFSHRHPIFPLVNPKNCRFLRFGAAITINNITSWGIGNLDTAIIGRFFETSTLGVYNRAFNLVNMPMYAITSSMQSVLLSAYAKSQSNANTLQITYIASVSLMALIFLPVYAAIAAIPDLLILGLYGESWHAAIPLMMPLGLSMAAHAMLAMSGPMLTGIGRPQIELKAQLLTLLFSIPALLIAATDSIISLIWAVFASYVLRFLLLTLMSLHTLKAKRRHLLSILAMPLVIAALIYGFTYLLNQQLNQFSCPPAIKLGIVISSCAICYPLLLLIFRKLIVRGSIKELLIAIQNKLPSPLISLSGLNKIAI
ncbi:MAG: lipopolysaccharide biosynthesis protein [Methylococcaceae bacterium]|jgi:O-antigen/teichoic acid export membrane protein